MTLFPRIWGSWCALSGDTTRSVPLAEARSILCLKKNAIVVWMIQLKCNHSSTHGRLLTMFENPENTTVEDESCWLDLTVADGSKRTSSWESAFSLHSGSCALDANCAQKNQTISCVTQRFKCANGGCGCVTLTTQP